MKKEYDLPTKEEYFQPGGHPRCITYIVDKYNNIYPQINWAELELQYKENRLMEYNNSNRQLLLFL